MEFVIHTDGGSRGNPGPAAIGVVIESEGKVVAQISEYIGVETNNVAEYTAVLRALDTLSTLSTQASRARFILDSLLVVEQLNKNYAIKKANLAIFAQQIWEKCATLPYPVSFSHVLRAHNAQADALVNKALDKNR